MPLGPLAGKAVLVAAAVLFAGCTSIGSDDADPAPRPGDYQLIGIHASEKFNVTWNASHARHAVETADLGEFVNIGNGTFMIERPVDPHVVIRGTRGASWTFTVTFEWGTEWLESREASDARATALWDAEYEDRFLGILHVFEEATGWSGEGDPDWSAITRPWDAPAYD